MVITTCKPIGNNWCTQETCKLGSCAGTNTYDLIRVGSITVMNVMHSTSIDIVIHHRYFAIEVLVFPVVSVVLIDKSIIIIVIFLPVPRYILSTATATIALHTTCVVAARKVLSCR